VTQPSQGQHVPEARAAHQAHPQFNTAFVQLFPFLAILAVHDKVSVPDTYIA
jgi:hypothetical protein